MRITSDSTKTTTVVGGVLVAMIATPLAAGLGGAVVGYAVGTVLALGLVLVATRCFRGPGEPVEPPRPWWRATNRPAAGYVLGVLFLVQAVAVLTRSGSGAVLALGLCSAVVDVVVAAYFLHSSVRLGAAVAAGGRTTA